MKKDEFHIHENTIEDNKIDRGSEIRSPKAVQGDIRMFFSSKPIFREHREPKDAKKLIESETTDDITEQSKEIEEPIDFAETGLNGQNKVPMVKRHVEAGVENHIPRVSLREKDAESDTEHTDVVDVEQNPYATGLPVPSDERFLSVIGKANRKEARGESVEPEVSGKISGDQRVKKDAGNDRATAIESFVKEIEKQELEKDIPIESFKNEDYRTVVATNDITLYRVFSDEGHKCGRYLTTEIPKDRMASKLDSSLAPQWHNTREYYCEVNVPKGTVMQIGKVAEQKTLAGEKLPGGADQIVVSSAFSNEKQHYGESKPLGFIDRYLEFEKKAQKIEDEAKSEKDNK